MVTAVITISLLIDRVLGEPSRFHPLIGFGRLALMAENRLIGNGKSRMRGVLALILLMVSILLPITVVVYMLVTQWPPLLWLLSILFLYLAIGGRSLAEHAEQVASALDEDNLIEARRRVGMIVSRDCEELDEEGVARAAVETVLENGSDAIFAPIFWFIMLGIPGVVLYRIVNTLDAMWGYRNEHYLQFGWAAARLDDVMNWIPARLTALGYTLAGSTQSAWRCWQRQGDQMASPNAGIVMAAGAGALQVQLGGGAQYHGAWIDKPQLGIGTEANSSDIKRAISLLHRALIIWLVAIVMLEWVGLYLV